MLAIKPVADAAAHETYCRACGIEAEPDALCYVAHEGETLLGVCEFFMSGPMPGTARIFRLTGAPGTDDKEALFIMARATLNYIDLHGVHEAVFEDTTAGREPLVRWIGFREREDGVWYMNLDGFFEEPCKHDCGGPQ